MTVAYYDSHEIITVFSSLRLAHRTQTLLREEFNFIADIEEYRLADMSAPLLEYTAEVDWMGNEKKKKKPERKMSYYKDEHHTFAGSKGATATSFSSYEDALALARESLSTYKSGLSKKRLAEHGADYERGLVSPQQLRLEV